MVQLIVGKKGKGKTKQLLDKVNAEVKTANGNIVYIDKSTKHMFELNNKVRLISATDYPLKNSDEFIGFICGIVSQDHDLASVYLDSFLKVAKLEGEDITDCVEQLEGIGKQYNITFVLSVSMDKEELPEGMQDKIIVALSPKLYYNNCIATKPKDGAYGTVLLAHGLNNKRSIHFV